MNGDSPAISIIVAISENGVIGRDGGMPWHLSADLRRFKRLTMGHDIIMGRKTFESIGRLLPGRATVIITRQTDYQAAEALVFNDLYSAILSRSAEHDLFVVGGSEIYQLAIPLASKCFVTRVHTTIDDGDTFFPDVDWKAWKLVESQPESADEQNDFDYTFETYERRNQRRVDQAYATATRQHRSG